MTQTSGGPQSTGRRPGGTDSFMAGLRRVDMRRSEDGWLGGVCAGLAARLGLDPLVIRALFVVLSLALGLGALIYLAAWLLVPDPDEDIHLEMALRDGEAGSVVLLVATLLSFFGSFGWFGGSWFLTDGVFGGGIFWGLLTLALVIGGGLWLFSEWRSRPDPGFYGRHARNTTGATTSVASPPAPPPASTGEAWQQTQAHTASPGAMPHGPGATAWTPAASAATSATGPTWEATSTREAGERHTSSSRPAEPPKPPQRPGRRSAGAAGTLLGMGLPMVVGGGLYWAATEADWPGSPLIIGLVGVLGALGLVILVLGLGGRTSGFPGFLAVVTLVGTALILPVANNFAPSGAMGEYTWTPQNADELEQGTPYRVGAGNGTLDLHDLTARDLDGQRVEASVTFGQLVIDVPDDLTVRIEGSTAGGAIRNHKGNSTFIGGINVAEDIVIGDGPVDLIIDARVGFGEILLKGAGR